MISIYEISILLAFVLWMELIISIHIIVRWILHWKLITIIPANGEVGVIKQVIITAFFLTIFALRTCLIFFAHSPRIDILRSNIL